MDLALGTDTSKSDAKDPVRFSALLGGPEHATGVLPLLYRVWHARESAVGTHHPRRVAIRFAARRFLGAPTVSFLDVFSLLDVFTSCHNMMACPSGSLQFASSIVG